MRPRKLTLILLSLFLTGKIFSSSPFEEELSSCMRGGSCFTSAEEKEEPLFRAFVSFSLPENVWIEMSQGMERNGGVFVLRGFPNNSLQSFLEKVMTLRDKGVYVPITIDPEAFAQYDITAVPTFIAETEDGYRKVVGNVTIDYALMKLKGELW